MSLVVLITFLLPNIEAPRPTPPNKPTNPFNACEDVLALAIEARLLLTCDDTPMIAFTSLEALAIDLLPSEVPTAHMLPSTPVNPLNACEGFCAEFSLPIAVMLPATALVTRAAFPPSI